ncbi:hypothetical protein PHLGIDRAFT_494329 [Phlebiopsis gigantea 11061_1 CR5-6]|uniref:Uncharacterized protein n=1 Tax=Phlebiopsis gigantea (strain 11061_1 CR5-6) TaxID=745531 RepID=A0A0C3NH49_PHLG1|nr:hypothetical protein PHLGIDRAFT_494329 [Phlebiopsis gigantea 11061_1 CR5-6]
MFIFTGKFDWLSYSSNDTITIVAPGVIDTNQPIWGFWQWTADASGRSKPNAVATRVYTGKLDWFEKAQNEMVTLILPSGLGLNAPVTLIFQWTQDTDGTKKAPYAINSSLRAYNVDQDGTVKATVKEYNMQGEVGYYIFSVEFAKDGKEMKLGMKNPGGDVDSKAPYKLTLSASP